MKRLLVLSGKGGTGKTTVSAALIRLAQARAVADCDVDAPNLHLVMEQDVTPEVSDFMGGDKAVVDGAQCIGCGACEEKCRFDAIRIMEGKAVVNEFSCEGCGVCRFVCPAEAVRLVHDVAGRREIYRGSQVFSTATLKMGRGNSGKLVSEVKLAMLQSAPDCDLAVVDGSPGIGCPVIASVSGMDLVLVVAEPSQSGMSDLKRLVQTVASFQLKLAVCVNKWDTSPDCTAEIETFCRAEGIDLVGKIPFDAEAVRAVNAGHTIVDVDCTAGRAVREIYKAIMQILNCNENKNNFKGVNENENCSIL